MRRSFLLTAFLLLTPAAVALATTGELTIVGAQTSGDYGGEVDSDTQSTLLRFLIGNKTQFRADLDLRRVRSNVEFAVSPLGPIPARGRGPQGPGGGDGGNGQGGGSAGQAAGSAATSSTSVPDSAPSDESVDDWNSGLGDLRMTLSRQILGGGAKVFKLAAELGVKAPTGDDNKNLGTGELDYRVGVAGNYRFWSATGFGGIGWNFLGDPDWLELSDALDAYAGVESEPLGDKLVISGWVEGNQEIVPGSGSRTALGVGVRTTGKLRFQAQLTAGLGGSAEDFSALAGVSFGVSTPAIGSPRIH